VKCFVCNKTLKKAGWGGRAKVQTGHIADRIDRADT
jgi:ribosomal protein S27E